MSSNSYPVLSIRVCVCSVLWLYGSALQALLSMGFSREKYWTALSFPRPGDLPDPGPLHHRWIFHPCTTHTPRLNCACVTALSFQPKTFLKKKLLTFAGYKGHFVFVLFFFLDAVCIFFPPLIQEVLNDYHVEHCAANLGRWKQKPSLDSAIKSFTEHYTQTLILESAKGHV